MVEALRGLEDFVRREGIRADLARTGLLTVSNGPEQDVRIGKNVEAVEALSLSGFHPLDGAACRELLHSERLRCGQWEDDALLLDPAALARGLKQAALRRGVRIFEGTPVEKIEASKKSRVEAQTPRGTLRADRGLIATNAWAQAVPALRRYLFTIYAYIILTEPLSQEQWRRIGWERRMGVGDMRIMRHFHRPTSDGRILWGGRDAPFSPRGPDPARDRNPAIFRRLEETFRWTFPQLDDVRIGGGWGGPVCGTVSSMATIGWLRGERILYALGYAGHGVGPSKLAGEIVCDLMLGRGSDITRLPMVTRRPTPLPPEPLRSLALRAGQRILQKVDDRGGAGGDPLARIALKLLQ
jgi:glycine/D-amino acid oxidase-like deaminating enzyme